jgi:predicted transcriptional regulator
MKKKKFVSSVIERGISYYSPLVSEEDYKKAEMKKFMEFWFENSPAKFMKLFVSCETISEEDAKEIKEILG